MFCGRIPCDPSSFRSNYCCHDPKTSSACGYHFVAIFIGNITSLPCHTAHWMGEVPEVTEGLSFNYVEQGGIRKILYDANNRNALRRRLRECIVLRNRS